MKENTYNGWTNYATWRINLEIFDGGYDGEYDGMEADDFKFRAIELLEMDCSQESLAFDYAMAFLDDVNWHEIAKAHKEEA
jgi:hypothetical protein